VIKVTESEEKYYRGPVAKCSVECGELEQSFNARGLGFRIYTSEAEFITTEKFKRKLDGEIISGNLSDFEKVIVKVEKKLPIQIATRAPKRKDREGELERNNIAALIFEAANGSFVVLRMPMLDPPEATFTATIESTRADERLPALLFKGFLEKK
jgi:hypothetical protein